MSVLPQGRRKVAGLGDEAIELGQPHIYQKLPHPADAKTVLGTRMSKNCTRCLSADDTGATATEYGPVAMLIGVD